MHCFFWIEIREYTVYNILLCLILDNMNMHCISVPVILISLTVLLTFTGCFSYERLQTEVERKLSDLQATYCSLFVSCQVLPG